MNQKYVDRAKGRLKFAIELLNKTGETSHPLVKQGLAELETAMKYLDHAIGRAPSCDGFARHVTDQWKTIHQVRLLFTAKQPIGIG